MTKITKLTILALVGLGCLLLVIFWYPNISQAQDLGLEYATGTGLASTDIRIIIARIIRIALGFLGILAVGIIVYGGFIWMTSGGSEDKIAQAKRILIDGTIGLIIIMLAFTIVSFIFNALMRASGLLPFGSPIGQNVGRGALGGGIIESHYPPRGAHCDSVSSDAGCIARNTKIIVTFKEPISLETIIAGYNDNGTPFDTADDNPNYKELNNDTTNQEMELNYDNIKIFKFTPNEDIDAALADNAFDGLNGQVAVNFTEDLKTFVFTPIQPLGSESERMWYMVRLDEGIKKLNSRGSRADAFPDRPNFYQWSFEVGTFLDLTPPRVESVYPVVGAVDARNVVVQINFNEAVDPTTVSGVARLCNQTDLEAGDCNNLGEVIGLKNIVVQQTGTIQSDPISGLAIRDSAGQVVVQDLASPQAVAGTFTVANQYKTVEFTTNVVGGVNSCGDEVYVLPANSALQVTVKAAPLQQTPANAANPAAIFGSGGYEGVVDVAGNSLNGNGFNGAGYQGVDCQGLVQANASHQTCAIGPTADNFWWEFFINNKIIIGAPQITDIWPDVKQAQVQDLTRASHGRFSRIMMARTLTSDLGAITLMSTSSIEQDLPWWVGAQNIDTDNPADNVPDQTTVLVFHDPFKESQGSGQVAQRFDYSTEFTGRIKDIYQNCFVPTSSISNDPSGNAPDCAGSADRPACCNAFPQAANCPQPLPVVPNTP